MTPTHATPNLPTTPALEAEGVSVRLGAGRQAKTVLHPTQFQVPKGQWLAIVGPNGAGKSTLLRALAGLYAPTQASGGVRLLGRRLHEWSANERAKHLAWLGQSGSAAAAGGMEDGADELTAYDVALLGRLPHHGWWAPPSQADHAATEDALRQTHAWHLAQQPFGQLSGGERQRVLLARALAVNAPVMLMDEPLAHLDAPHQADWVQGVKRWVAQGRTVVSVLHELHLAFAADQVMVMQQGRVVAHGAPGDGPMHTALRLVFDDKILIARLDHQWAVMPKLGAD